ncbi:NAD(+) kinase [Thioalkalivibrio sp. HK1]|uniref:NAD(+) kinase n=1 Tax=Thioalkalivibrio sp. HK1 TaxID=1469245 RepID=UPI00046F224C|nr:NAD(+) kinase [Thioalkalivibrio sp. HK1]
MTAFRTIGLIAKKDDPRTGEMLGRLIALLDAHKASVVLDESALAYLPDSGSPGSPGAKAKVVSRKMLGQVCDLVVVVAGDGTFLSAARSLVDQNTPLLGVNLGRVGFLADITPDEVSARLDAILRGRFIEESRFLLDARIRRAGDSGEGTFSGIALNEVAIHKSEMTRLLDLEIIVDGHHAYAQRADGLIVATPTGSTAYALSGGGPVLHPSLDGVVLVPICPQISGRPIVLGGQSTITLRLVHSSPTKARLSCDGQKGEGIEPGDCIVVRKHRPELRLIHPEGHDFYATLRTKLHWGRGLG